MNIKEIRKTTGLTQKDFSAHYHIPLQTLKQWESSSQSTSHRVPPEYVLHMLQRLTEQDFGNAPPRPLSRDENLVIAAQESVHSARQWLRYLRKEFPEGKCRLTSGQIHSLLSDNRLTMYQKISLSRAVQDGTATNQFVTGLNEHIRPTMLDEIKRRRTHV